MPYGFVNLSERRFGAHIDASGVKYAVSIGDICDFRLIALTKQDETVYYGVFIASSTWFITVFQAV